MFFYILNYKSVLVCYCHNINHCLISRISSNNILYQVLPKSFEEMNNYSESVSVKSASGQDLDQQWSLLAWRTWAPGLLVTYWGCECVCVCVIDTGLKVIEVKAFLHFQGFTVDLSDFLYKRTAVLQGREDAFYPKHYICGWERIRKLIKGRGFQLFYKISFMQL